MRKYDSPSPGRGFRWLGLPPEVTAALMITERERFTSATCSLTFSRQCTAASQAAPHKCSAGFIITTRNLPLFEPAVHGIQGN